MALRATPSKKKVAFLFRTYDGVNLPKRWATFFAGASPDAYSLHVLTKSRDAPFVPGTPAVIERARLAPDDWVETDYDGYKNVDGMLALLRVALRDERNVKFAYLSGACIPLKPIGRVLSTLLADDLSDVRSSAGSFVEERCAPFQSVPEAFRRMGSSWMVLSRAHALLLTGCEAEMRAAFDLGGRLCCQDEHAFLTTLALKGAEGPDQLRVCEEGIEDATTFVNWGQSTYRFSCWNNGAVAPGGEQALPPRVLAGMSPVNYNWIGEDELRYLEQVAPALFGRKFVRGCVVISPTGMTLLDNFPLQK